MIYIYFNVHDWSQNGARIAEHLNPDDGDAGVSLGHQQGCQSNLLAEVCPARGNNRDIKIISTACVLVVIREAFKNVLAELVR